MIDRYTREEMGSVWSKHNQYASWLEVEIAVDEAWAKLGEVPEDDVRKIRENATFDEKEIAKIEAITHHDVVAFTRDVSKSLGPEKKWIHFGMTSTDVVDTAQGYRLKQANKILKQDLEELTNTIAKKALKYKDTVMMGRTHGVQAEPTTFGLKIARWYSEMKRNMKRFEIASNEVEAGKISGAVGTFANVDPFVEKYVCNKLGIRPQEITSQILPRDLHADYIACLGLIATSLEEFATEIRSLQRSEIHEVEEHFAKGQKGSSAMPHKRNPIGSENICGLARVVRGHIMTAYEDIPLWHERDISHSSAERIILPDTTILLDYMLHRFNKIVADLDVFPDKMKKNLNATNGLIYSQRVMLKLIDSGMSRESAYDLVQPLTAISWDEDKQFKPLVENNETIREHLSTSDIEDAFDYHYHIRLVDDIFKRIGLIE
ncbi:adenylosuccinate lyase [Apilactobacillus micheneri]|uniref:adenylosuccinate lyase n=1 Tax=Apilactobacillus micheneri TaxID=1899430 RepID=UPI00112DF96A|nr:adenylosuccinate lyase [Apilactobacillus micheneri]TPR42672.1 adenylosuccinate lyase [Apilactobacillus micheneri]TPR45640.1 adenylosuccinate lyase [Apilactobacillus micheneri]TPR49087.1 adenylosuccinate lyase [Apilactobacillus micheneri]TPR50144.1 adenylosuccinate lyase [Apilactobacillus micheneri]TPR52476.1 adenylosuccinate lyase [Apilactobacillus micheneri]